MIKIIFTLLLTITGLATFGQVSVRGYYKKDGTYVQPHIRSSPDRNPYNNYSYPGNINPYTGKTATGNAETYLEKYKSGSPSSVYSPRITDSRLLRKSSRIYLKNDLGERTMYLIPYHKDEAVTRCTIYNITDEYQGYVSLYNDGSFLLYDTSGKLIGSK